MDSGSERLVSEASTGGTLRKETLSPFTLAAFAATFVAISAALVHIPRAGIHPHVLALTQAGHARVADAPLAVRVRELDVSEASSRSNLPAVSDLTVLMPASRDIPTGTSVGPAGSEDQQRLATDVTRLPPLSLAPLGGTIVALEKSYESLGQRDDRLCEVEAAAAALALPQVLEPSVDFGRALAAAAMRQTGDLVVYTDKYRRMAFPMGDVPSMFGVCTDVVIRAYRALGIDLQARIHVAHIGSGDRSIAHRRTFTLRRYFASRGASLPVTSFAEDYLPGDVVTYDRPQNRRSRDHIAIVTDVVARSGRPMIVHNRGWGPQLEDALFVDRITGHYRYQGRSEPIGAKAQTQMRIEDGRQRQSHKPIRDRLSRIRGAISR